jgi:hypothetical protein
MKYRIVYLDPLNWGIEEWQEGGEKIEKGRHKDKLTSSKWKPANSFYPTLKDAAIALLDKVTGDKIAESEGISLLNAILAAEKNVIAIIEKTNKET